MEPVGTVGFEAVPERWIAYDGGYADMGVALGQASGLTGSGDADRYYTDVYDELPGVTVNRNAIERHPEVRTKEQFYELDNDVHLYDPRMLINWFEWSRADVEEVATNVAPFVGNLVFRHSDEWHDYRYYTLYEAFEKVAAVFQAEDRYRAFERLHDEFIAQVRSQLPAGIRTAERAAHLRGDRRTRDVLAVSAHRQGHEQEAVARPRGHRTHSPEPTSRTSAPRTAVNWITRRSSRSTRRSSSSAATSERPQASSVRRCSRTCGTTPSGASSPPCETAVSIGAATSIRVQIHNLFLTERGAKQIYPETFGDVTGDDKLFDRQRVADIVTGSF